MAKKEIPDVTKFFTDPANAEEAGFFREAVNFLVDERVAAEKAKNPPANDGVVSFFDSLVSFGKK